jgi:hypothetical protein
MLRNLSPRERDALLELGKRGSGGDFDQIALSKLFVLGLVEVSSKSRRLVLTSTGREVYDELASNPD